MVNSNNAVPYRKPLVGMLAAFSALMGVLCSVSFWVLLVLSNYLNVPFWLSAQFTWQGMLFVAVVLAVLAAFLGCKFRWAALVLSLGTFLFVMYAAGV
jgi:hypothetical protein